MRMLSLCLFAAICAGTPACGPTGMSGPSMNSRLTPPPPPSSVISVDILDREPRANRTVVKHILIGWADLEGAYSGGLDPRAAERSKRDAEVAVRGLQKQLAGGADFDVLMKAHSEDRGSAASAEPYTVEPGAQLVIEFRQLGLRLDVGEVGVVESSYGFHVMKRLE